MTPHPAARASLIRLAFWRSAAVATEIVLRHRRQLIQSWPYLILLAGGLLAYAMGRLVGAAAIPFIP